MGLIEDQPHEWDVIASKPRGFLPHVAVAKQTTHRDRVSQAGSSAFSPDADLDEAAADFVDWLSWHRSAPRVGDVAQPFGEVCQGAVLLWPTTTASACSRCMS